MAVQVICEASKNFINREGMTVPEALENAKKLAWYAKDCGGDIFKTQCHVLEDEAKKRHTKRHTWIRLNEILTPFDTFWKPLKEYCDEIGIEMLVTPMSRLAAIKINPLVIRFKVASPDILDYDLLAYLKSTGKEIILSSGMTEKRDQQKAKEFLERNYYILHCVSEYVCPLERMNLYEVAYYDGLSDHSKSLITGALAVMKGAKIIEKHFTFSNWGKDANVSLSPEELKVYIQNIRDAEKTLLINERPTKIEKETLKDFWI